MKNMFRLHKVAVAMYIVSLSMVILGTLGAALAGRYEQAAAGAFYTVLVVGFWYGAGALHASTKRMENRLEKDT